ncbi:MAG: hypothetical protein F4X93_01285 [Proteobacteria bacterium]|nr:hypothetical protein [Pseudomonadota bacterium]
MTMRKAVPLLCCALLWVAAAPLQAQVVSLNYERLSSLEDPLAMEFGDVTYVLNGLADLPLLLDLDGGADRIEAIGNFEFEASTQLSNRWLAAVTYFGQYVSDSAAETSSEEDYTDNLALSVGSYWGTVVLGNVSGIVREQTRRLRGAGNASLAFDDALGRLGDDGGGYLVRFGPWLFSSLIDDDDNVDLGVTYQRPTGTRDYRLTARYTDSTYTTEDRSRSFDSTAFSGVAEVIFGSTRWDLGAGYEHLSSDGLKADRWYASAGGRIKAGVLSLSLEGHYGQIGNEDEVSAAFGIQYDLARGLSVNLGLNHTDGTAERDGTSIIRKRENKAALSMRYSF